MLKRIFYIFLVFISIKAVGQRTNSSPYSFFGIGQQFASQTVEEASMGGVGISYSDFYHLNFMNPAGLANLRFSTFSIGATANKLSIKDVSGSQSSTSTNLSYVSLGFPIGDNSGMSVGLQPNSSVGYSLLSTVNDANGEIMEGTRFFGTGGTNRVFANYGRFLTKNLSLGVEIEYIFGNVENNILNQRANVQLATKNEEETSLRGGGIKFGLQYKKLLASKLNIYAGAVVKLENSLSTSGTEHLFSLTIENSEISRDTLYSGSVDGKVTRPLRTGVGFGIGKTGKWYTGIEYEFQSAMKINGSLLSQNAGYAFGDSNKFSVGGFYLPKANSITSYWDRVIYRAGVRFEKTGLLVKNTSNGFTEINDFGISFGLGLPLRDLSNVNLGIEYGKKGSTQNNLIQENYFNFRLSLSLTDKWFQKRKID